MRKLAICASLLLIVNFLLPLETPGQDKGKKKDKGPKTETATTEDYAYVKTLNDVEGKLTFVDLGQNKITLVVEYQKLVPKNSTQTDKKLAKQQQNQLKQQQQLMREYENIMNIRNLVTRQQRLQQLALKMQTLAAQGQIASNFNLANQYDVVTATKEFDFDLETDCRIARLTPLQDYDEKGNIKKYTADELKEMKDPVLPGYKAKPDELFTGQKVRVYFSKKKTVAKKDGKSAGDGKSASAGDGKSTSAGDGKSTTVDDKKAADDKKGTDPPLPTPTGDGPLVRGILIEVDVELGALPANPKKKKK